MAKEKWAIVKKIDIPTEASTYGRIRDAKTKEIRNIYTKGGGYKHFREKVNGIEKTMYVHRCVLYAFNYIEGCDKLNVNHKDFNPSNNNLSNLEWCTQDYNMKYGIPFGRYKHSADVAREIGPQKAKEGKLEFHVNITQEQHRKRYEKRSLNYSINNNHPNKGKFGLKGTNVKLTIELIKTIKERVSNGEHKAKVARSLKLSRSTIYNVVNDLKKYL